MSSTESLPRYIQLSNELRSRIQRGEWNVGDRLPSFADMYDEYGASTTTMQKVYELLQKEGLITRRARSGVYVSRPAPVQTGIIAYVIPQRTGLKRYGTGLYSLRLLQSIHEKTAELGYQMTLCSSDQLPTLSYPVAGCIVQGETDSIRACANFSKHTISLITQLPGVSHVGTDDKQGYYTLTQHLLALGHRRISAIIGSDALYSEYDMISPLRYEGYQAALKEHRITPQPTWQRKIHQYGKKRGYAEWGFLEMQQWLRDGWARLGCTAVVTQNDLMAIGVIKALRQHGYRVPQDVSVTGYDGSGEDAHFDLNLTTIRVPLEEIGRSAVHLMNSLMQAQETEAQQLILPTQLVTGESAGEVKGDNS